jgi:hypothetical protein
MSDGTTRTVKHNEVRDALPSELVSAFDDLVEQYQFYARKHYRVPFVSYLVLSDLIRAGWRPSAQALPDSDSPTGS